MPAEQLETLTKDELYELAKNSDIAGRSDMDKAELLHALMPSSATESEAGRTGPTADSLKGQLRATDRSGEVRSRAV